MTALSDLPEPAATLDDDVFADDVANHVPDGLHDAEVERIFAVDGALSQAIKQFKPRDSQTEMAKAIAQAISQQDTLIAEAGTGTGKTYAYLVPALLWGGKVIVSTGTKNLQDQLFLRDIPTVRKALKAPVSIALLKGRANYLCHYHLERTQANGRLTAREDVGYLRDIGRYMKTTSSGDKAELTRIPENASVWNLVTSTRENCLGSQCQYYQDCFVMKARKEAQQADVVVVNHHLFFADVALKDSGVSELLPSANTIIFDEAHQLPEVATLFFGDTISTSQIIELCRDTLAEGLSHARDGADWSQIVGAVEKAARDLRLCFAQDSMRLAVNQIADDSEFFPSFVRLQDELDDLCSVLEKQAERAETIEQCHSRAEELSAKLQQWDKAAKKALTQASTSASVVQGNSQGGSEKAAEDSVEGESVLWVEAFSHSLQLHQSPLSVAPIFAKQRAGTPRS
ncbi:MAG: ATP-dependent DNA helicase, partial [Burkholderiales bacterium]|nr:ATP-dependent DNA helicase [Burkholderiales bacterium]